MHPPTAKNRKIMGSRTEYWRAYKAAHREHKLELKRAWYKTKNGRALNLATNYRRDDKKQNRGESTLTPEWIVNNIFTRRCIYCGCEDWHQLGADRINNDKPHTPENCVPCCVDCNTKRHLQDFLEYAYSIGAKDSDGLIIKY